MSTIQSLRSVTGGLPRWMQRTAAILDVICFLGALYAALVVLALCGGTIFSVGAGAGSNIESALLRFPGSLIPCGLYLFLGGALSWGMLSASRCFRGVSKGKPFTRQTTRDFRNFALGLLIYKSGHAETTLLGLIFAGAIKIKWDGALSYNLPPDLGDRALTLILVAAVALVAAVLSRATNIAEEASALAVENEQFV